MHFLIHSIFWQMVFVTMLIMNSAFVLTSVEEGFPCTGKLFEYYVYVWAAGDFLEEMICCFVSIQSISFKCFVVFFLFCFFFWFCYGMPSGVTKIEINSPMDPSVVLRRNYLILITETLVVWKSQLVFICFILNPFISHHAKEWDIQIIIWNYLFEKLQS